MRLYRILAIDLRALFFPMNPYSTLGVAESASAAEITRAYRRLAMKLHPDRNKAKSAEDEFKLVKEAYEFINDPKLMKSSFGNFTRGPARAPEPQAPPTSPYGGPEGKYNAYGGAVNVPKTVVHATFSQAYKGGYVQIPGTPYRALIKPGTQNGEVVRQYIELGPGERTFFDIEYLLHDPIGFYKLMDIDGKRRFCCHLNMTLGQILSSYEHSFNNVNPDAPPVRVVIPADFGRTVRLERMGLRLNADGDRGDLYVIPVIKSIPLQQEIEPVLVELRSKIDSILRNYRYF